MSRISDEYAENPIAIHAHCVERQEAGEEISTGCARAIAAQWHNGQSSAFYSFASSGYYSRALLLDELSDTIAAEYVHQAPNGKLWLDMLGTYFINRRSAS